MRFKASVPKDTLALLLQVTQALRRVELASSSCAGRRCVLRLSREGMSFGLVCAADDARAWADLDPRLFERYMVESRARRPRRTRGRSSCPRGSAAGRSAGRRRTTTRARRASAPA